MAAEQPQRPAVRRSVVRHRTVAGHWPAAPAPPPAATGRNSARGRWCRTAPSRSGSAGAGTRRSARPRPSAPRGSRPRSRRCPARGPARCWPPSGRRAGRAPPAAAPVALAEEHHLGRHAAGDGGLRRYWRWARRPAPECPFRRNAAADSRRCWPPRPPAIPALDRTARSWPRHSAARAPPSSSNRRRNRRSRRRRSRRPAPRRRPAPGSTRGRRGRAADRPARSPAASCSAVR